jgi:NADPH:quinone reductase-like Zn-dependent oxidoreductase
MKAIVQEEYGSPDTLELREIEKPELDDDGVLVRVRAASLNALDWRVLRGHPYIVRMSEGWRRPSLIRGVDLAGEVEAIGKNVTQVQPGGDVYGERAGSLAEYLVGKEERFAPKPSNLSFEQAAAVPCAALTALQGLRDKAQVKTGRNTQHSQTDLLVLKELIEAGEITPVVDRTYPLSKTRTAMRYVEEGRARGKVVITI